MSTAATDLLADDAEHWLFCQKLYAENGISTACLHLQDTYGVDVPLLLISAYAWTKQRDIDLAIIARANTEIAGWRQDVIAPLRALRRALKTRPPLGTFSVEEVRHRVSSAELRGEQVILAHLASLVAQLPTAESPAPIDFVLRQVVAQFTTQSEGADVGAAISQIALAVRRVTS